MPRKRILSIIIVLVLLIFVYGLSRQIMDALTANSRLDKAVEEVSLLQSTNRALKSRLNEVQEYGYVEEVARDKLNMAKSNETVVIIPPEAIAKVLASNQKIESPEVPNWQGWLNLFF